MHEKYEHVQDNLTPKKDVLEIFTKHRYLVDSIAIAQCYAPLAFSWGGINFDSRSSLRVKLKKPIDLSFPKRLVMKVSQRSFRSYLKTEARCRGTKKSS